jgi:hypothetical protein
MRAGAKKSRELHFGDQLVRHQVKKPDAHCRVLWRRLVQALAPQY